MAVTGSEGEMPTLVMILDRLKRIENDLSLSNERTGKVISAIHGPFGVSGSALEPAAKSGLIGEFTDIIGRIEQQVENALKNGNILSGAVGDEGSAASKSPFGQTAFNGNLSQAILGAQRLA